MTLPKIFQSLQKYKRLRRNEGKLKRKVAKHLKNHKHTPFDRISETLGKFRPHEIDIPLIRIGPETDGGYLVPDDLEGIEALFSPGVSDQMDFDLEISRRGIDCFLADASIETPIGLNSNMSFEQMFLGPVEDEKTITLSNWVTRCAPNSDDLFLQMDIEGAEFSVIQTTPQHILNKFRIILIEIHDLHRLLEPDQHALFDTLLDKLTQSHVLCHIHANNYSGNMRLGKQRVPNVVELTLIRKDRVKTTSATASVPHPLDRPNSPKHPDVPTPEFWN